MEKEEVQTSIEQKRRLEAETLKRKYEANPNEKTAFEYAKALYNLTIEQIDLKELVISVTRLEALYNTYNTEKLALAYSRGLFNLLNVQKEMPSREQTVISLKELYQTHPKSDIAFEYAKGLVNFSVNQKEMPSREQTVTILKELYNTYLTYNLALAYATGLSNLINVQKELSSREQTVNNLKELYNTHSSGEIALSYAKGLVNLTVVQKELLSREQTVNNLKELYNTHSSSALALRYAKGIQNLLFHKELENSSTWIKEFGELFRHSKLNQDWVDFVKRLIRIQIENGDLILSDIIPWSRFTFLYLEELLDSIFYYKKGEDLDSDEEKRQIAIFWEIVSACRELLSRTKYTLFQDWTSDSEKEQSSLFQVYRLTQLLKFKLAIKKFEKDGRVLEVGHYTKKDTLNDMIRYRDEDKDDYPNRKVKSKSRLYNANYMNDTQEGILLDNALGRKGSDKLKPSQWYLMSLTNNHDNLSMWSQYGGRGEGVCIVLRNDSFKTVSELGEMDSFTAKKSVMEMSKESDMADRVEEQETKKDELYRICYLKGCEVVKSDLFEEEDVEELQEYLTKLRTAVEVPKHKEAIDKCLEEIRYLFKSADYAYESEVRVLSYVSEDDRKNVKYDLDDPIRRLYIERQEPMQIKKVIFGPKFANADFATPYIQWVDNGIQFESSKIHFR